MAGARDVKGRVVEAARRAHDASTARTGPQRRILIHINITRGDPVHSTTQDTAAPASDKLVLDPPGQLLLAELKVVALGSVEV